MGAIVSRNDLPEDRNCPSAVLAAKAKIRQDLMKGHLRRINIKEMDRPPNMDEPEEDWRPEWFPPGIHYPCKTEEGHRSTTHSEDGQTDWMTHCAGISSKDLHNAMFKMSRENKQYHMRLIQVNPLYPSEINLEREYAKPESSWNSPASELQSISRADNQTNSMNDAKKSTGLNAAVRKVAPSKEDKSVARKWEGIPSSEVHSNGSSSYDINMISKGRSNARTASSPIIKANKILVSPQILRQNQAEYESNALNEMQPKISEDKMFTKLVDANVSDAILQGQEEESQRVRNDVEKSKFNVKVNEGIMHGDVGNQSEATAVDNLENVRTGQQQECSTGYSNKPEIINDENIIVVSISPPEDTQSVERIDVDVAILEVEEEGHTMVKSSDENCPLLNLRSDDLPSKTGKTTKAVGKSVAAQTIVFPTDQVQNRHSAVKLFPSKLSQRVDDPSSTINYRISLERKSDTKELKPEKFPSPTQVTKKKTKIQLRGLYGWNLPQNLVKRKMEALEKNQGTSALQYIKKDRDSMSALIAKYGKVKTPKMKTERHKLRTATAKSSKMKGLQNYSQMNERLKHLEKLKKHEPEFHHGMMMGVLGTGHVTQKDREMDSWINHVRQQQLMRQNLRLQQSMRQKMEQEEIQQPQPLVSGVKSRGTSPPNFNQEHQESVGDDETQHDGNKPSSFECCTTTTSVCQLPVENRPAYWVLGKGCGEWSPLPNSNKQSSSYEKTNDSTQAEHIQDGKEKVDSLVKLLYEEVEDKSEDKVEESKVDIKERNVNFTDKHTAAVKVPADGNTNTSKVAAPQGIGLTVKMVMAAAKVAKKKKKQEKKVDPHSILMSELDDDTIRRGSEFRGGVIRQLSNLTDAIQMEYHRFLTDVDYTNYYAARQMEVIQAGDYTPRTVLLISSTVPKCEMLRAAVLPDVLVQVYDYHNASLDDLLQGLSGMLRGFKEGAKAKYLGIVCKGGPGYFYLVKKMPVTPARIRRNEELLEFWQNLGNLMTKLIPDQCVIHLMESNVAGNRQGEKLIEDLASALLAHRVRVESPLELAPSGKEMLQTYFNIDEHRKWKEVRYKN